jgi:ABC-type hemin transport system substrate-binding protein
MFSSMRPDGMTFATLVEILLLMNNRLQNLATAQLRTIIIHEMRKFALALEYGSTISDLQEIRDHIKMLADILTVKEREESLYGNVEKALQAGQTSSAA